MAQTSTITINYGGEVLVGADVFSTAETEVKVTDGAGQISGSFPDDYATVVVLAIRHNSFPMAAYVAMMVLESGEDYVVDIPLFPNLEISGNVRGIHCPYIEKT